MNPVEHRCHCGSHVAVRIRNLNVRIGAVSILEDVSAEIPRGMCTAIVGPNGAERPRSQRRCSRDIPYKGETIQGCFG